MNAKQYLTSESQRKATKDYYERNKEKIKQYSNDWLTMNPERRRELQREYYQRKKARLQKEREEAEKTPGSFLEKSSDQKTPGSF